MVLNCLRSVLTNFIIIILQAGLGPLRSRYFDVETMHLIGILNSEHFELHYYDSPGRSWTTSWCTTLTYLTALIAHYIGKEFIFFQGSTLFSDRFWTTSWRTTPPRAGTWRCFAARDGSRWMLNQWRSERGGQETKLSYIRYFFSNIDDILYIYLKKKSEISRIRGAIW